MDCPHCHTENLLGAATCAGCGGSLRGRPSPGAGQLVPPISQSIHRGNALPPAPKDPLADDDDGFITPMSVQALAPPAAAPQEVLCRMCTAPFQWRLGDAPVCPTCRQFSGSAAGDAGMAGAPAVGSMVRGIERVKPKPVIRRRSGLPRGLVAIVVGGVLVASGFAVVRFVDRRSDAGSALVQHVRSDVAKLVLAPPQGDVKRFLTTLRLQTVRKDSRLGFGTTATLVDFRQSAEQEAEVSLARADARGAIVDVFASCRVLEQAGRIQGERNPREKEIYPFAGHSATVRAVVAADAEPVLVDGGDAVSGRDVPPLFTIGSIGAGERDVQPGNRWRAEISLPFTTDRNACMFVERFPADVSYIGRTTHRGFVCAAFRIVATAPKQVPDTLAGDFDKRQARVTGNLLYELSTGLLAEGALDVDQRFWKIGDDAGEELKVTGRLELRRK